VIGFDGNIQQKPAVIPDAAQRFIGALLIRDLVTSPRVCDASFHAASRTG